MPRSKEDNQLIREERIREIKEATIRIYALKGYLGTQMEDIAKEAGLAKGLLYYYFKSKKELFQYVFRELMEQSAQQTDMIISGEASLEEALSMFCNLLITAAFERPIYPLVYKMLPEDLHHVFPDTATEMKQQFFDYFTAPLIKRFTDAMEKGEIQKGNPIIQTILFTSGVLTVSHSLARNPSLSEGKSPKQIIEETKQQLFYGIFGGR